jgi:cell division protein FtsX
MSIKTAYKALSLKTDPIFKLLVVMIILLGWLASLGASSIVGLENLYKEWNLTQKSRVNIYLLAQTDAQNIDTLTQKLLAEKYVTGIKHIKDEETESLLKSYIVDDFKLELPKILELQTTSATDFAKIKKIVDEVVPTAQVDDPSEILNSIANGVRFAEGITLVISLVIIFVISLIVALTTRAGLRAQKRQVEILQFLGATDSFIALLTVKQVFYCSLTGFIGSTALSIISIYFIQQHWTILQSFILPNVWFIAVCLPLFICLVAVLVSMFIAKKVIRGN